jgi:hypothetical protein
LPFANKKGASSETSNHRSTELKALPSWSPKANVEENWTPPNIVENISDAVETITDDNDMSDNIVPKIFPRTSSNSAWTGFEEEWANPMTRYVYAESRG